MLISDTNTDVLFVCLETYAISDEEWHFVAFSYNATRASGFLVLDEKVRLSNSV